MVLVESLQIKLVILIVMTLIALNSSISVLDDNSEALAQGPEVSWSMAGANPQRTSWVPEGPDPSTLSKFGVQWFRPIEAYIGQHVQLVAARDKIYVASARGLYVLSASTGDVVWRFDTELPLGHSPTVVGNTVYIGGFDKRVYAFNADNGNLIWRFDGAKGGFSTNPLVVEGKVLLGSRDGYFYALDQTSGNLIWQYPTSNKTPLAPILYSAAYKDGKVFFAANDNYGYALNVSNGTLLWKSAKMPGDGYQAWWPVVYGNYVVFSAAIPYSDRGDPGTQSFADVVDENDPYYSQMNNFQFSDDFVKTIQRDDVFHQGEPINAKLGPEFKSGSIQDTTGISWSWPNNQTVINANKATQYLEDDGQTLVNRATNKPWRRGVIVLNVTDGTEFTYDSDSDGKPEYAPFLFTGTKSGNRYPPLVIPTKNSQGESHNVLYAQNLYELQGGWGISRAGLSAWEFGTPYIHFVGRETFAIDEPFADSSAGNILYENLCCDRLANWQNLETGDSGVIWSYGSPLESIKLEYDDIEDWMKSVAPGYDQMWYEASMYDYYPRLFGNYGTINGIYHNHGLQNPLIPYKDRLFVHRSNAIIAFGPNAPDLRRVTRDETPERYEQNIKQEYPNVVKPPLIINNPNQNLAATLTLQDVQRLLDGEISKILQKGHLRPGYYNGTREHPEFTNYFENPGDTLYTLVQVYPYVSSDLKNDLEKYIEQHYKLYFDNQMAARTGYWLQNSGSYNLNDIDALGQLQPREWMPLPPEVATDLKTHQPDFWPTCCWPWDYPQHNFYAMWKYAQMFHQNDLARLTQIYKSAKSRLQTTPPDTFTLVDKPWIHNAFISGYTGFLKLQELAGKDIQDSALRSTIQTNLNELQSLRANDFRKDQPWVGTNATGKTYWRSFSVARNFMNLTPELGLDLNQNALNKVKTAVDEYDWVVPYWVATRYESSYGEFSSDNLFTHSAMFQAKAYIIKEPAEQLLKYIDSPSFETGDLFYIQNLVAVLANTGYGYRLEVSPAPLRLVDTGGSATFVIDVIPTGGFSKTITFSATHPSSDLEINLSPNSLNPPGRVVLTLTDKHPPGFLTSGLWYIVPFKASGDGIHQEVELKMLVNAQQVFLPLTKR